MTYLDKFSKLFPVFIEKELISDILSSGKIKEADENETIMDIGQYSKFMPLVLSGALKVLRQDEEGEDLFLYYLYPGQSCALTLNCCTAEAPSTVKIVAEEDETQYIALPTSKINGWINQYPSWRNFMMQTFSTRFNELLETVDSIAFQKMDDRLINYLHEKSSLKKSKILEITHQHIANDLHTSREVISRLLKQLEKQKKISLSRNKITLM